MDTGKILKVIDDIVLDEGDLDAQSALTNLVGYYEQDDVASITSVKSSIEESSEASRVANYTATDFKVLQQLGGEHFFGPGLYENLDNILDQQPHEVVSLVRDLIAVRSEKLASLRQLRASLSVVGFKSRALSDDNYEIGFSLPDSYTDINTTEKTLGDISELLNAVSNGIGKQQPLHIAYVSNGSIELFIEVSKELANSFSIVLDYALKIYEVIAALSKITSSLKAISKERRGAPEKAIREEKKARTDALIDELIEKLHLAEPDDVNSVTMLFRRFLAHMEKGVNAEVRTPDLLEPVEPEATSPDAEKKEYAKEKKLFDAKITIDERNKEIFKLQQNNFNGLDLKFLYPPEDDEPEKTT